MVDYADVQTPNYSGFLVIGGGLPRTGTMSLRAALGKLLEGACYHMLNVGTGTEVDVEFWNRALDGKVKKRDWVDFLQRRGFRAGVDYPISLFYRELMEAYPDAKVVLTVRDPEKWYDSVKSSILNIRYFRREFACTLYMKLIGYYRRISLVDRASDHITPGFDTGMFTAVESGQDEAVAFYNKWVEEVKATVPKDRLLVFSVRQGWKPLCDFLDLPIPDEPFPNVNDTEAVKTLIRRQRMLSYAVVYVMPTCLAALAFWYFYS